MGAGLLNDAPGFHPTSSLSIHRLPKICHLVMSNHIVLGIPIILVPSGLVKINYIASGKYKCGMLFQTPSVKVSLVTERDILNIFLKDRS